MKFRYIVLFIILTCGCEKMYPEEVGERIKEKEDIEAGVVDFEPETVGYVTSNDVLERAYHLASVEWTPIKQVSLRKGAYFKPGKLVKGVPYSSVKEINNNTRFNIFFFFYSLPNLHLIHFFTSTCQDDEKENVSELHGKMPGQRYRLSRKCFYIFRIRDVRVKQRSIMSHPLLNRRQFHIIAIFCFQDLVISLRNRKQQILKRMIH